MQNAPLSIIASKESINKSIETNNIEEALLNERRCYRKTLNTKDRIEALNIGANDQGHVTYFGGYKIIE